MKYYYLNLPKEKKNNFETNISVSTAIQKTAEEAFVPFEEYLKNAIESLKKKNDVEANWVKLNEQNIAELQLEGRLFEIPIEKNRYRIIADDDFKPDFEEPIIYKAQGVKNKIEISQTQWKARTIELSDKIENFDSVSWGGEKIALQLIARGKDVSTGIIISENTERKIVYLNNNNELNTLPENKKEIIGKKISTYIDNLQTLNGDTFEFIERDGLSITLKNTNDFDKKLISDNGLKFKLKHPNKREKDFYWIQLLEKDSDVQTDENQLFSPLRYFFDDNIEIKDSKGNFYEVADGKESENTIVLRKKGENGEKSYEYCFPEGEQGKEGSVLTVKVNTYQLEKQLEAISTLKNMPIGEHVNLIKLFNNKEKTHWIDPDYHERKINWEVLTDYNRDGCPKQRLFVEKALNTPDFAILEGPPGSGKTTVILELICQIIKQGKRILLCGSTHVAIDNVLERLKEKKLLEKYNILPVRIGDENRINDDIKEFQIDNLIKENDISEDFLLDAANLVCGTTIGILRNPKFMKRKGALSKDYKYYSATPIVPEYDYLIIDESSKTTFQEFLVPALYAKKWILAGDVMQLSPFTDRSEIVSNISQVKVGSKPLKMELQYAVFYLQKIKECLNGRFNKFIFPISFEILTEIQKEYEKRENDFEGKIIYFLHNQNIREEWIKLKLYATDVIFIDINLLKDHWNLLPETHAVLVNNNWLKTKHAFEHNSWQKYHNFFLRDKGKKIEDSYEIIDDMNRSFLEKNWAEEVAWRIDREHQLRLAQGKTKIKSYSEQIENLIPKSVDANDLIENINQIATMAFPSILESLVHGIKGRKTKVRSTISEGFYPDELRERREILEYQQRMHPEISAFPRERFYSEANALQDSRSIDRKWDYSYYNRHNIWIDVKGKTERNYNNEEIKVLSEHLKHFIDWAKHNPQPEGKNWTIACLTFYRGQETKMREQLRKITEKENAFSNFNIENGKINIKLHTVDKFQGHEADIVFLSMVQTQRDGFLDNPNRLNVAITRAKYQLVIFGNYDYFSNRSKSEDLKELAKHTFK